MWKLLKYALQPWSIRRNGPSQKASYRSRVRARSRRAGHMVEIIWTEAWQQEWMHGGMRGPGDSCVDWGPWGSGPRRGIVRQRGNWGRRGQGYSPLMSFCFLDYRRISPSSKIHPRPRKGPQTWQEEMTDPCSMQWKYKLWAGHL